MDTIGSNDERVIAAFRELLSFYGVELQSHGSLILGAGLLIFAVVQAWAVSPVDHRSSTAYSIGFSIKVAFLCSGIMYQAWRLYAFGKLALAILYASDKVLNETIDEWNKKWPKEGAWSTCSLLLKRRSIPNGCCENSARRLLRCAL